MSSPKFKPLSGFQAFSSEEMKQRSHDFLIEMQQRRTVRHFSSKPVPKEVIENCLSTANTAPSGANMQPWHFVCISNSKIKKQIREAAEEEERDFYNHRAPKEWLEALAPLGTDSEKPFLETAPSLIVAFTQRYGLLKDERQVKHYYAQESVGLATGMLITAIHHAGLVSLTHTPSPMGFLNEILNRPVNEKAFLILVVGYPDPAAVVPDITKKPLSEIATFL